MFSKTKVYGKTIRQSGAISIWIAAIKNQIVSQTVPTFLAAVKLYSPPCLLLDNLTKFMKN